MDGVVEKKVLTIKDAYEHAISVLGGKKSILASFLFYAILRESDTIDSNAAKVNWMPSLGQALKNRG